MNLNAPDAPDANAPGCQKDLTETLKYDFRFEQRFLKGQCTRIS